MRGAVLVAAAMLWGGAAAASCPGLGHRDDATYVTARQLMKTKVSDVRAGGTVPLEICEAVPGAGNVPFEPSVAVHYIVDRKRMDLEVRTAGDCDTVLLLRSPSGRWYFDDDNGDGANARLRLGLPAEGVYEIWVGSQEGRACAARLELQTVKGALRLAVGTGLARM
jgi:hypothetical protein